MKVRPEPSEFTRWWRANIVHPWLECACELPTDADSHSVGPGQASLASDKVWVAVLDLEPHFA